VRERHEVKQDQYIPIHHLYRISHPLGADLLDSRKIIAFGVGTVAGGGFFWGRLGWCWLGRAKDGGSLHKEEEKGEECDEKKGMVEARERHSVKV